MTEFKTEKIKESVDQMSLQFGIAAERLLADLNLMLMPTVTRMVDLVKESSKPDNSRQRFERFGHKNKRDIYRGCK